MDQENQLSCTTVHPNRSTDDHMYTLRRLSEERWRKGLPTYVFTLDLNKAFDRVNVLGAHFATIRCTSLSHKPAYNSNTARKNVGTMEWAAHKQPRTDTGNLTRMPHITIPICGDDGLCHSTSLLSATHRSELVRHSTANHSCICRRHCPHYRLIFVYEQCTG